MGRGAAEYFGRAPCSSSPCTQLHGPPGRSIFHAINLSHIFWSHMSRKMQNVHVYIVICVNVCVCICLRGRQCRRVDIEWTRRRVGRNDCNDNRKLVATSLSRLVLISPLVARNRFSENPRTKTTGLTRGWDLGVFARTAYLKPSVKTRRRGRLRRRSVRGPDRVCRILFPC